MRQSSPAMGEIDTKQASLEQRLALKMSGEITLSESSGKTLKKWREIFKVSQKELADVLGVSPSVISDYESGRRKSPGIKVVAKIVNALVAIDKKRGSKTSYEFANMLAGDAIFEVILDMKEMLKPTNVKDFVKLIDGEIVAGARHEKRDIFGYTVVDSLRAIVEFSPLELARIYGSTTERAIIFTKIQTGRSPMIAIKMTTLKPALVILHGITEVDPLAIRIAESEGITLATTKLATVDDIIATLRSKF